jgi:hypothetical protein
MNDDSDLPPEDATELLEHLEDLEEEEYLAGRPPAPRPLTRTEIDGLVNETLDEELTRRRGAGSPKSGKE